MSRKLTRQQEKAMFAKQHQTTTKTRRNYKPPQTKTKKPHKYNVATVPLTTAHNYADHEFKNHHKNLDNELPDFDSNYLLMQKYCQQYAKNIPRDHMPVIEPSDMAEFDRKLEGGYIDIFSPYAMKHPKFPKTFKTDKAREGWVLLGQKDGNKTDDVIEAQVLRVSAKDLKPLQSQIWLDKLVKNTIKFGTPEKGSPVTNTTIIMSKEGYILDGHHRWGQVMLSDPDLKMKVLQVPLDIDTLLKVGRSYGAAVGNKPKK